MVSLGEKLESFYLALLTIQSKNNDPNLIRLADVLYELETHNINENDGETNELLQDILKDARKKSSQILRIPYIESINQLITSSRKRLKAKTALDNETSIQHGQRYVHIFLELLGNWSNIIINLMNYGFSKEIIQLILQPLHIRIIEMAKECFLIMKQDKDLDSWCIKLMQSSFSSSSSNDDKDEGSNNNDFLINLTTLDNFTIQLSTMRNIINQHYLFLFHTFLPLFQPPDNDENNNNDHPNDNNNNNNLDHYSFLDHLLIVNKDELLQWKEIDMIYITLEIAYLQQSIIKACLEGVYYISLEDNIFILQLFEDSIFLFHKIIERCKQTNEEKVLFMISQKILEMLQFTLPSSSSSSLSHDDGMMSSPTSSSSSTVNTALFAQIIHNKRLFYYAYREKKVVYQRTIKKILSTYTGRDFLRDDQETVPDIKRPLITQPPTSKDGKGSDGYQTPLKPNAASSSNLALSAVTSLVESNSSLKQAASFFFSGVTGGDEDRDSDVTTATSSSKPSDDNRAQFPIWNEVMNNAAMSGVNQWIGWASPLLSDPTTTTVTNTNNNMKSPPRSSNGVEKSPSKKMPSTMEELLLHALDLTDDSGGKTGGVENDDSNNDYETSTYYYDHSYQPFFSKLIENDFIIYLNCLSVIIKALISLRVYLIDNGLSVLSVDQIVRQGSSTSSNGASTGSGGSSNSQSNSSIWVLIKEYWKCEQQYEEYLLQEMKQYIKQKYYIFERKQYEQLTSLQSDHSATSLLSLDTTPSNVAGNHPKVYLFKSYLERSYDITGQMMEERIQEQYIKHYYLLFLQQFPFSLSYFQLPEDKSLLSSSSSMLGSYGQSLAEKLPSFLVNPLTNFFFQSENEETSTSSSAITSGTGEGKQSVASSVESNNRSLLSESHYVMVLSEVVLFLLQQIVHRIIWGGDDNNHSTGNRRSTPLPQINEWGALLLQDDINSLRRYYDQCVFRYLPTSYDENEFNHKDEGEQEGVDSKNSNTNNDREYYSMNDRHVYYINQVKKYFLKISKIMILLTLDSPQDALRYQNMILLSSSIDQNSSLKVEGGTSRPVAEDYFKRKEDEFHEEEVRYLLTRRKDFSKDMIQRIKFNN